MSKAKTIIRTLAILVIIITIIPLFSFDIWFVRMFDFPHIQLTVLTLIATIIYFLKFELKRLSDYAYGLILISCLLFQFNKIKQFTPLISHEVLDSNSNNKSSQLSLFTANVLQDNENSENVVKIIKELDADILLFTEVNKRWSDTLSKAIGKNYKYSIKKPLANTYGILLFSKFELINPEIKYMVDDSIPSVHTKIKFSDNEIFQLYGIHPTPPMPQENINSTDRDAEMMMTADLASKSDLPVIVMGDFNDVAWSSTMQLFKANSKLLDARIGRGFYCTYNAENYVLRWPLDHIFTSKEFRLVDIKSCSGIDSDHFPYYMKVDYLPKKSHEQEPKQPTESQKERAKNQIENFKKTI